MCSLRNAPGFGLPFRWRYKWSSSFLNFRWKLCGILWLYLLGKVKYVVAVATVAAAVLIEGFLEASYPSSTTLLVMCVMPTAVMQFNNRIKNGILRNIISVTIIAFVAFMVIGRLISGVHWFTDIVGGSLLSAGLVMMYYAVSSLKSCNFDNNDI